MISISTGAHDFWSNGEPVDPATKRWCCNQSDHYVVEDRQVRRVAQGFRVTGRFDTTDGPVGIDQIVAENHAIPSPDGQFHIFLNDGSIRCIFAPMIF